MTPACDVYSLALTLYEAWTGTNPVRARRPRRDRAPPRPAAPLAGAHAPRPAAAAVRRDRRRARHRPGAPAAPGQAARRAEGGRERSSPTRAAWSSRRRCAASGLPTTDAAGPFLRAMDARGGARSETAASGRSPACRRSTTPCGARRASRSGSPPGWRPAGSCWRACSRSARTPPSRRSPPRGSRRSPPPCFRASAGSLARGRACAPGSSPRRRTARAPRSCSRPRRHPCRSCCRARAFCGRSPCSRPLLGTIALAPAFIGVAALASTPARRAGPRRRRPLVGAHRRGAHREGPAVRRSRRPSCRAPTGRARSRRPRPTRSQPLLTTPALAPALVWAAGAVVLALVVRGRWLAVDLLGAGACAAALIAAHAALGERARRGSRPRPRAWRRGGLHRRRARRDRHVSTRRGRQRPPLAHRPPRVTTA